MSVFGKLTVRMKILLGILAASTLAVIVASVTFVSMEEQRLHDTLQRELKTIAKIVADTTAGAIAFEDSASASQALSTLKAHPHIIGAVLYNAQGELFASYERDASDSGELRLPRGFASRAPESDINLTDDYLEMSEGISSDGSRVGRITLRVDLVELNELLTSFKGVAVTITFVLGLVSAILAFFIQSAITQPINKVVAALKDIAEGEGDLTQRLQVNTQDELGELAQWFNRFVEKVHDVVTKFRDTSENLGQSAAQLLLTTEKTNQGVLKQQHEIDQTASAITELSGTVQEVVRNVAMAANDAEEADSQASQGKMIVDETMQSIENLAGDIESAAEVITRLQQESDNIGAVLEVIGGIAEQTNLLALNAAIEAARAGEQGRGFAVVADEVRTLASRTQSSTQEIQEMIERLQAGAKEAVQVMQKGREQASTSVDQAEKAGESLEGITKAVSVIKDMSKQIASASEEQRSVTEEINQSIVNISQVASQTADDSQNISSGSDELNKQATELKTLISQFKL